jgi:restriction system protein
MARRRKSIIDVLFVLPWWVSVIAAAVVYVVCAFALPAYFASSPFTADIGSTAKTAAPYAAALFLLVGFGSFVRSFLIRRKFDSIGGLEGIRDLSRRQFESIVGEAFRRRGYSVMENAVDGPDGGIDLVLRKGGEKIYVQCKQWKKRRVGVKPIRELYGVIVAGGAKGGFFVASGDYSEEARAFAKRTGIQLIDGPKLAGMLAEAREPEPFMDPTIGRREPTISAMNHSDRSVEWPEVEPPEVAFQSESRSGDPLGSSPFGGESSRFFSGTLKIALGLVVGGVILWGLLELYVRYRVNQFVGAVEQVAEHIESELDRSIRTAREREQARQPTREAQPRLEQVRQAAENSSRTAAEVIGQRINESQRDNAIRNAQQRISDDARCAKFKDELLVVGRRHNAAAKASFFADLDKVKKAAEVAGCIRGQTSGPRAVIHKSGDSEQARQLGVNEKEAAWAAFYKPSEKCLDSVSVECGNEYIRVRREFERRYADGEM